jgi:RecB family exonuclease
MRARGEDLVALVDAVHRPEAPVARAPRPEPRPPVSARPRRLSVTQIETLVRDPYAVYARHVLGLAPLDPLGRPPDYLLRGSVVHEIVHAFVERTEAGLPAGAAAVALFLEVAGEVLAREVPWPDMRRIWRGRLARVAPWFVDFERRRRAAARPAGLEIKGSLAIDLPGGPFTISARADRIDRYADGAGAVIDYKTGSPPSKAQVASGFSQQLHLQAAMLMAGGFTEVGPLSPREGAYVGLTGSREGGKLVEMAITPEDARAHLGHVAALLAAFDRAQTPYLSWARPQREADSGDYDHLARRGEWQGSEDGDA